MNADKQITDFIKEETRNGVRSIAEMERSIHKYVKSVLFFSRMPPSRENSRFYPSHKTIWNHMYNTIREDRYAVF